MPTRQVFLSLNCSLNSRTSPSSILRLRPNKPECWYFWLNHEVINTDLFCYLNWNKTLKLILPPSAVCLPTLFAHHHCVPAKLCALCAIEQYVRSLFHLIYLSFILVYKFFFRMETLFWSIGHPPEVIISELLVLYVTQTIEGSFSPFCFEYNATWMITLV